MFSGQSVAAKVKRPARYPLIRIQCLFLQQWLADDLVMGEERTSVIRSRFTNALVENMQARPEAPANGELGQDFGGPGTH